ncbi:hypothetical protein [Legionella bononiensis]|uniref:Uncharacterized protein n=1 Tax=Legionella bononiensis TaxID=2793102 RepID=A0ABS1WB62_9GAMM|nr:hypothetical protein [Legionella bononiensis]MBL7480172.1 hypothetical protein [Legionella bononiensis]MBL7526597.1 hypothetical protein [Legionella bononiensis]MBL7562909.1 hypothetical protein [Legionella bononiensis]
MMGRIKFVRIPLARTNPDISVTPRAIASKFPSSALPPQVIHNTSQTIKTEHHNAQIGVDRKAKVPDSKFFNQLKSEEHKQFFNRRRARYNYYENYSAALALPCSKYELVKKRNDRSALLALSRNSIIEHANRRVDLFFYTLIAYYKTGILPTNGHTSLQHGRGRTLFREDNDSNLTQACHSSFTPALLDKTLYQKSRFGTQHKCLLSGTHLMDSLNSTVELPPFVNELDDVLEHRCRQKTLELIGQVSLGILNPIEGLVVFLKMMRDVLTELKQSAEQREQSALLQGSFSGQKNINPKLIDLVMRGTLRTTFFTATDTVSDEYIQLLLRMNPEEKALSEQNNETRQKVYLDKIADLQKEILETKSELNYSTSRSNWNR